MLNITKKKLEHHSVKTIKEHYNLPINLRVVSSLCYIKYWGAATVIIKRLLLLPGYLFIVTISGREVVLEKQLRQGQRVGY